MSDLDLPLAVRMMQDGYLMEIQDLKEKNEKLRELLAELYESAWLEYPSAFEHTFAERLRELGIEVDA